MADHKKKKISKKVIIIGVIIIIAIIAVAVASQGAGGKVNPKLREVETTRQDIVTYFNFSGNIESHDTQYVKAKSSESISRLYVKEGDKVKKGDLLYEVDSAFNQSSVTQASSSLANAQTDLASNELNLERMEKLFEAGGISQMELERARDAVSFSRNQVLQAQASLEQAMDRVKDTKVYAEIDGEVSKIYVKENESIIMGTSIMDIVDFDNLEVNVKVDEFDLGSIKVGQEVDVAIEALNKVLKGTISEIAREASVEMGVSYFMTTVVLPEDSDLRIGLSAEIMVETQRADLEHHQDDNDTIYDRCK
jgi:RND family efflux transporter MFP subunit